MELIVRYTVSSSLFLLHFVY